MGQRYSSILNHLNVPHFGVDFGDIVKPADGYIIATPTETHRAVCYEVSAFKQPILCEKPFAKDPSALPFIDKMREWKVNLQMVNQYVFMPIGHRNAPSGYDYFKHGGDGLAWDCINVLGLANGECVIQNLSPYWHCIINGEELDLGDMDGAYVDMVAQWVANPVDNLDYAEFAHKKVLGFGGH